MVTKALAATEQAHDGPDFDDTLGVELKCWSSKRWLESLDTTSVIADALLSRLHASSLPNSGSVRAELNFFQLLAENGSRDTVKAMLKDEDVLEKITVHLWDGMTKLADARAAADAKMLSEKFVMDGAFTMFFGAPEKYFAGLKGVVGDIECGKIERLDTMESEHLRSADSDIPFEANNYGTKTTSAVEYAFVTHPEKGPLKTNVTDPKQQGVWTWPQENRLPKADLARQAIAPTIFRPKLDEINSRLEQRGCEKVDHPEFIGARLYTGPMFEKYNAVVRGLGSLSGRLRRAYSNLCNGNKYVTTLHVINNAVLKLGRLQRATTVYRGISGGVLPEQFWTKDEFLVRGGIEMGFLSTTHDLAVAKAYASTGKNGAQCTMLEIEQGLVDRGAELDWLSQYPHESEVTFPPLTALKVVSAHVEESAVMVKLTASVAHGRGFKTDSSARNTATSDSELSPFRNRPVTIEYEQ
eukprot:3022120-Prymnesium_polylepis.2